MYIVLGRIGLVPAFNGVQFDMAILYPVLACLALTYGQVAGLPACFYSGASLIRFHQPRRRHLPRTDKSYHFSPIFVSRIRTEANTGSINLLHLPLFIGNSDGIPVFTFLDRTCSILEEVSIFFFLISLHEYPMQTGRLCSTGVHVSHSRSLVMCLDTHSSPGSSYKIFSCSTFSVSFHSGSRKQKYFE